MMMKRWLYVLFLGWLLMRSFGVAGQQVMDAEERQRQIAFIQKDTIPVEIEEVSNVINTQFSEYNGVLFPDSSFFFSSLRPESESDYGEIFEQFWSTRIYRSQLTVGGFSKPVSVSPLVNDNKYYNCGVTFNEDRTLMIFARCLRDSGKKLQCSLWRSDWKSGHWNKPQQLNRRINLPGTTTTQPNWVDAGDYSVLYFVSDRPRGFGELDIWYSIYQNNHFNDPINAGSVVNTPDNEITPFYDKNSGRLYFSSDGTHLTIGGYDVFYTEGALSKWTVPTNIGVPINSSANDIYFTVNKHDNGGYFASNRPKNPEDDADTCCTDLYRYQWLKVNEVVSNEEDTIAADTVSVQEKVTMLLPITLYFHNDEPDPRTTATTTTRNYRSTLADYIAMKDTYKTEYSRGLKGEDAEVARQRIERFFADSVERGFRKLEEFSQLLLADLTAGNSVTITVCGFASPLHKAEYNYALSSRRIASFVNYLKEYKQGVFLPYLSCAASNRLVIVSEPEGSSKAAREVSDNPNDKRNSVYSISASLERRIQVTQYTVEPR